MPSPSKDVDCEFLHCRMVEQQLQARGISDTAVQRAMQQVPRENFLPEEYRYDAYKDGHLPIGSGQTIIKQPYIVGLMTELVCLGPQDRVLEVGTGSGYQTAVLQAITPPVYSLECISTLAHQAVRALCSIGLQTVRALCSIGLQTVQSG